MVLFFTARKEAAEPPRRPSVDPVMTFTREGLVLGGTVLARLRHDRDGAPAIAVDGAEERILALLAVVYGKRVRPGVLGNIRRAARYWQRGEDALAGLPLLAHKEQASARLRLGEWLLAEGLSPRELIESCGLDASVLDFVKAGFNPDQPRVPPGNPAGGQWTSDGDEAPPSIASEGPGSPTPLRSQPSSAADGGSAQPHGVFHGYATVYTEALRGHLTATGEAYDPNKMTAAVLPGTIPLKSVARVTLDSDASRSVDVYVNDHGLYQRIQNSDGTVTNRPLPGRVIDLSSAAFKALTGMNSGKVMVTVTVKASSPK